jgi:hypothetical protein
VEAATPVAADPTPADRTTEHRCDALNARDGEERSAAELRRLMDLADRYAHQLVAATDVPVGVLLLVHHGDLDVLTLDDPDSGVWALPRMLALQRPSSAALVLASDDALRGPDGHVIVVGETSDGLRDERRFRVRACGRARRLTRVGGRDEGEARPAAPRLFPPRVSLTA